MFAGPVKAILINFHQWDEPSLDLDNLSKPIFDAMQGLVYEDDRQIIQAEIAHVSIGSPFVFVGISKLLAEAIRIGNPFIYVRVEDPVVPLPLPS